MRTWTGSKWQARRTWALAYAKQQNIPTPVIPEY
jgi:hypothetical protein